MTEKWTPTGERDLTGEPLYQDEHGYVRMVLLPESIREKLPSLGEQENVSDPIVYAKLFSPAVNYYWYVLEFDGEDLMFCWVEGHENELGYVSLSELEGIADPSSMKLLPIKRDVTFKPKPLSEVKRAG